MIRKLLALLSRRRAEAEPALRGRPPIRREKAYAADSGYVYQYTYEGYRPSVRKGLPGCVFVFECTADRASRFALAVFAPDESFEAWERLTGRDLNQVERYAIVKMHLFETFDQSTPDDRFPEALLTADAVERHIETLDL